MSLNAQDRKLTPRNIASDLKRFLLSVESPTAANVLTLSDCGYILLILKDKVIHDSSRNGQFIREFVSRPINGIEVLTRVVMTLQNIINGPNDSNVSLPVSAHGLNTTNKKRKAAVAEADCIEVIKIFLEKSELGWSYFLESATGMDAVLLSVHSPQLDSKCFALEILLLLLNQEHGFIVFMRALTAMATRVREYQRLLIFVTQLKHGIHTQKLHIQILVVRLFNKLLSAAPNAAHQNLIIAEAYLAQFSPDMLEKIIANHRGALDGVTVLLDELNQWKMFSNKLRESSFLEKSDDLDIDIPTSDTSSRRSRAGIGKTSNGSTTMSKSVEKQKAKRLNERDSIGRTANSGYYPSTYGYNTQGSFVSTRSAQPIIKRNHDDQNSPKTWSTVKQYGTNKPVSSNELGIMRRAKSESSMLASQRNDQVQNQSMCRGLKRYDTKPVESNVIYHPIQRTGFSRSVHDLSNFEDSPHRIISPRPCSALTQTYIPSCSRVEEKLDNTLYSPRDRPTSSQARFAEPLVIESQPHAGFSYLFPQQPVVSSVITKRSTLDKDQRKSRLYTPASSPPIGHFYANNTGIIDPEDYHSKYMSRSDSRAQLYHPVEKGVIGEDVLDALSQFDYLDDYDHATKLDHMDKKDFNYSVTFQKL